LTTVHDKFTSALRARIDGQFADLGGDHDRPDECFLSAARAADIPEEIITSAVAEALGLQYTDSLGGYPVSHEFVSKVPISFARRHSIVALAGENGVLPVAISDLAQRPQLQMLSRILNKEVKTIFAPREEIIRTINTAYQQQSSQAQRVIEQLDSDDVMTELQQVSANEDLLDVASRAPVIKLVNLMLFEAVKRRASDVHVQPYEDKLIVRFRVDGVLHDVFEPPKALQEEVLSRIKVMGQMNIAERRLSQDGRATVEVGDRIVDLRIATLPTCFGERAVIRLLDKSIRLYELGEIGMPDNILGTFRRLIHMDHGIVLVTGPTGSGKSTTLYAALQEIDSLKMNVVTLEDPIEYRLDGISQTQVSDKKGMKFASGLRSVLRQDPDIIMVGEIRDGQTAQMAIQSALTGHLVFSTLHTNDAAGAVARMLDLGVEPYLLASSLLGVMAQRLVRQICPACRSPYQPSDHDIRLWGLNPREVRDGSFFKGTGCESCLDTGYRERRGIFELLTVDDAIREMILQRATASGLKAAAADNGMTTLRIDAVSKAIQGLTTMDEVARVTGRDEF
jgi:general secretion pathway protein E